jgi:hypothetical protein
MDGWWLVAGDWELVAAGWVAGCRVVARWLVAGGWRLVAVGWWLGGLWPRMLDPGGLACSRLVVTKSVVRLAVRKHSSWLAVERTSLRLGPGKINGSWR